MIAKEEQFYSAKQYNRYLFAVKLAKQINEYLRKGYTIIKDNEIVFGKFVFISENSNDPIVGLHSGNCVQDYLNTSQDDNEKWFVDYTINEIKKVFSEFLIVKPKNIRRIKFNVRKICKDCKHLMICSFQNNTHGHIFCTFNKDVNANYISDCNHYEKKVKSK